ncbi:Secreted RxLR effector protein [Sesamum angolense]|uniref:Secreted RxLR effector protein n=1 Tax=Sesamum angolense TaxID=2727404 RepID=A0AAE2C327_9LAMI|nr:Secreted RxLR effector protein [Sesamum angolense]
MVTTPLVTGENYKKEYGSKKVDGSIYRSLIGSLLYLLPQDRILCSPQVYYQGLCRVRVKYTMEHSKILTKDFGIWYRSTNDAKLVGYTDSDWAGSTDDMKNIMLYFFTWLGIFSWASKKQATVAQSSAKQNTLLQLLQHQIKPLGLEGS